MNTFVDCAYAPTEMKCQQYMGVLKEGGTKGEAFLSDLLFENWCNVYFKGEWYGEICSNAIESFSS